MLLHVCTQPRRPDGSGGGRGRRVGGLLRYLLGPGRAEEHINVHHVEGQMTGTPYGRLVAVSGDKPVAELQPVATASGGFDYRPLVDWLEELPRAAGVLRRVDGRHPGPGWVWHASLRLAPQDRHRQFSDATWAHMVREVLRGAGLVVDGDEDGVRWVVVRHADDHVHIVASLVREDGRREWFRNDFYRCVNATRQVAERMGLRQVRLGRGTGHRRPHPVEVHKAARLGRFAADGSVLTVRDELRRRVRAAAVGSVSPEGFGRLLQRQGVRVNFRVGVAGERTGIMFALDGDVTAAGVPVWYGGGRLAPELAWPRLRARWAAAALPGLDAGTLAAGAGRGQVLSQLERVVRRAGARLRAGGQAETVAVGQAAADCLTAAGWLHERDPGGWLAAAAERFDAAVRQRRGEPAPVATVDALRLQMLAQGLFGLAEGAEDEDDRRFLRNLYGLCVVAERVARLRQQQGRVEQAGQARAAAATVRGSRTRPRTSNGPRHAATVRQVVPELAGRILTEPGWGRLAATMDQITHAGGDAAAALRVVAGWRDLRNARRIGDVLAWRLRRYTGLYEPHATPDRPVRPGTPGPRPPRRRPAAAGSHRGR